jgi:hypothetical protein
MPFFTIAGLYFSLYPLIAYTLARIAEEESKLSPRKLRENETEEDIYHLRTKDLFKVPRFVFGLIS